MLFNHPELLRLFAGLILLILALIVTISNPDHYLIDSIVLALLAFFIGADLLKDNK